MSYLIKVVPNAAVSHSHYQLHTLRISPSGVYEIDIKNQSLYENVHFFIFFVLNESTEYCLLLTANKVNYH